MKSPATIRQVAEQAGVSVGTVSRVINGYANVSPENLRRVREAIAQLEYRVGETARSLAGRRGANPRTGNIGLLFTRMDPTWANHPLLQEYMDGVQAACDEQGFHALLEFGSASDDLPRFLREQKVDGVLVKGSTPAPRWILETAKSLPVVGLSMHEPQLPIAQVMPDNRAAGWQVAEYLWGRGHRRIAFVAADGNLMFLHRQHGVEEFLRVQDSFDPSLVAYNSTPKPPSSQPETSLPDMSSQLALLWDRPVESRPTAIVASNDWTAAGLYAAIHDRGLSVPRDVSVAAFDNVLPICCSLRGALTSYEIPLRKTGYTAARLLFQQINSPDEYVGGIQLVAGKLIERESVACVCDTVTGGVLVS